MKPRYFQLLLISFLLLQHITARSDNIGAAVKATQQKDFPAAIQVWSELAKKGDPIAQYNVGLFYEKGLGVPEDKIRAHIWYVQAAKGGLVEAYIKLQSNAIKPGNGYRVQIIQTPQEWILAQNPRRYTLQLVSSTNRKLIMKYYEDYELQGKAGYYMNRRQGKNRYVLLYGAYPSVNAATAAIASLPKELRKWSPWVRKVTEVQRNIDSN